MRAGSAILQQMSPGGWIWKRRCVTNQRQITNATMQQSTVRRRRSIEGRSRVDCTTAQSLAQVGCCFRAVDVIDISWLMCRSILMFFLASRGVAVDHASYLLDMRRLKGGEGRVTNLLGYFTEVRRFVTSAQNICHKKNKYSSVPKQLNYGKRMRYLPVTRR
eukprot:scaffold8049_cov78-Cyclotella_meneghiniana.AAC.4